MTLYRTLIISIFAIVVSWITISFVLPNLMTASLSLMTSYVASKSHVGLMYARKIDKNINIIKAAKLCMINAIDDIDMNGSDSNTTTWLNLPEISSKCNRKINNTIKLLQIRNSDDRKFVLRDKNGLNELQCIHVTLGVGGDIKAEEKLLKLHPKCKMYGCDPSLKNGEIFAKIGHFTQIAVVHKNKTALPIRVMMAKKYDYKKQITPTMSMSSFFDKMSIGHEFEMLKSFERMSQFSQHHAACIVTLELHWRMLKSYRDPDFHRLILSFLRNSNYALVHIPVSRRRLPDAFRRQYVIVLVNYQSPICLAKLLRGRAPTWQSSSGHALNMIIVEMSDHLMKLAINTARYCILDNEQEMVIAKTIAKKFEEILPGQHWQCIVGQGFGSAIEPDDQLIYFSIGNKAILLFKAIA